VDSAVKPQNDHMLIFYLDTNFGTIRSVLILKYEALNPKLFFNISA